ncbi:hypothetical protein F2P56_030179 [Juglans regia]|uniref:TORTIFOLIA1/SINE1-2 N-terminal domain-containing protein n=2 Tax=Juglans regia TaxID=51240 RepID=A0A833WX81_JUGRE|nr:TORTIFOLIA1-like protein 4 [Juglans regia]KAF5449767.1 hypothetical protein F2P56_030179 [Juglans regia]
MSLNKRFSSSPPQPAGWTHDLKHRVITCLNKLSDRDTLAQATNELQSIARALSQDSFSPFLSCLHNTDASSKSPVRKQCVHLLTLLSHSHGNSLSPVLSKMISTVLRRLRDPDSAVRSACIDAVAAMSSQITKPPFSALFKPLMDAVTLEQDLNSQIGSSLCLAAAIEATPDPEVELLRKSLPRLGKLVKSEGFKAKAALLVLIGSVVGVGGASNRGVLDWLVPCVIDFLSSEDWAVRKAAAEALGKVAVLEKDIAADYKASCLNSLENRRFDKVKVVRETMNHTLESWKEVPCAPEEVSVSSSKSSSTDNSTGGCFHPISQIPNNDVFKTPKPKKTVPTNRSQPSASFVTSTNRDCHQKSNDRHSSADMFSKLDHKETSGCKIEVAVPNSSSSKLACEDGMRRSFVRNLESGEKENGGNSKPETKRMLFSKPCDEKVHKFGSLRSGSRVVPFQDDENHDLNAVVSDIVEEFHENNKDVEDLSLIREQLLQIEHQQFSLLELLQRFMGSSQSGINSLETRVHGLEVALEEISYDLAISSGRIPNIDSAENTCCKLPGAEFLSSKFWRRAEGRYSTSRFLSSDPESRRFQPENRIENVVKPLEDGHEDSRGNLRRYSNSKPNNIIQDVERVQVCNASRFNGASLSSFTAH